MFTRFDKVKEQIYGQGVMGHKTDSYSRYRTSGNVRVTEWVTDGVSFMRTFIYILF